MAPVPPSSLPGLQRGYDLFGLQWGRECWVSKALTPKKVTRYGPSGACNYTCPGNPSITCGGWFANDIYTVAPCPSSPASLPTPSPSPSTATGGRCPASESRLGPRTSSCLREGFSIGGSGTPGFVLVPLSGSIQCSAMSHMLRAKGQTTRRFGSVAEPACHHLCRCHLHARHGLDHLQGQEPAFVLLPPWWVQVGGARLQRGLAPRGLERSGERPQAGWSRVEWLVCWLPSMPQQHKEGVPCSCAAQLLTAVAATPFPPVRATTPPLTTHLLGLPVSSFQARAAPSAGFTTATSCA